MQFIDEAKIFLRSGDGGNGAVCFHREKFIERGGPDGGDGGRGGNIVFVANPHLNTLLHFRHKQHFQAANGDNGQRSNRTGKSAEDLILEVPVGTQIFSEAGNLMHDCTKANEEYILLLGGRGGLGNSHFKSSVNQAPRYRTEGIPGEEMFVWLKLKLLSDAGLIGMPNAGKSTFLARTTAAHPKIADYPFTTLTPGLGVVYQDEFEFVLADIPGLIEGAHLGHGLGDKFLKHIERCGILLHLIDANSDDLNRDYQIIRRELEAYSELLASKTELVVINKCDSLSQEEIVKKKKTLSKIVKSEIFTISAHSGMGVKELLRKVVRVINPDDEE